MEGCLVSDGAYATERPLGTIREGEGNFFAVPGFYPSRYDLRSFRSVVTL